MTTALLDSIVSKSVQEIDVDYVEPKASPITLREKGVGQTADRELIFGQKHNDIECALCPTAKRPCDRAWFSAKQVENWSEMSTTTLWRWLGRLEKARRIQSFSDMKKIKIDDENGRGHETTLYNLNVLNQLAMACIDNEKLNDVSCKFSDMLSEKMTEGMSGTQTPMMVLPQDYEAALEALLAKVRENKALQAERDEAIRTKYHFVEGRDAKVCGELGGLRTQNENLRKQVGDSKTYKAVTAISWLPDYFDISNRGLYNSLASKLKKVEAEMPPKFAHIDIPDSRYGTVKAYHVAVIEKLHEMIQADEKMMDKYRKVASF